jgi:Flp pilus assembly protein TadG
MRLLKTSLLARFARDRRAVSAVEFALSLPFLLVLYVGGIDLSQAVSADRKVTLLARTVSDLVSQSSALSSSDVTGIFSIASAVLYPLALDTGSTPNLTIKVSQVWTKPLSGTSSVTKVDWSIAQNATAYNKNDTVTIPDPELNTASDGTVTGTATVVATVSYVYTPPVTIGILGPLTMSKTIYTRPRLSECVKLDGAACGSLAH